MSRKQSLEKAAGGTMKFFRRGLVSMTKKTFKNPATAQQKKNKSKALRAIEKLKQKDASKSKAQLEHDYIFCIINERELFRAASIAIERGNVKPDVNRPYTLIGLQILSTLIELTQKSLVQECQDEYLELVKSKLQSTDLQIQFEAIKCYVRLLKVITKNSFDEQWTDIFEFTWNKIKTAQDYIKKIGFGEDAFDVSGQGTSQNLRETENPLINPGINDSGDSLAQIEEIKLEIEEASNVSIGDDNGVSPPLESQANEDNQLYYQELIHELSFDLFSFLSARVSFKFAEEDGIKSEFFKPILANFNESNWAYLSWMKFVVILMVCNGGNDVMNIEEDTVQARLMKLVTEQSIVNDASKAEKIIDFQMLDALVEDLIKDIGDGLKKMVESFHGYQTKGKFFSNSTEITAPKKEDQEQFAKKLINQLKILIDLLQLQAITKGADKNRIFFQGLEMLSKFFSISIGLSEAIDTELKQTLIMTCQTYLLGVRTVTSLLEKMNEWIRSSHEQLIPSLHHRSPAYNRKQTYASPDFKGSKDKPVSTSFISPLNAKKSMPQSKINQNLNYQENYEEIFEQCNRRSLDIFLQTIDCLLEAAQSLLSALKEDSDQDVIEQFGHKLKLIKAETQVFILTLAQISLRTNQGKLVEHALQLDLRIKILNNEITAYQFEQPAFQNLQNQLISHKHSTVTYLKALVTFFDTWMTGPGSHPNSHSPSIIEPEDLNGGSKQPTQQVSPEKIRSTQSEKQLCILFFQLWSVINHFMLLNSPTEISNDPQQFTEYGLDFNKPHGHVPRQSSVMLSQPGMIRTAQATKKEEGEEPQYNSELLAYLLAFLSEIVQRVSVYDQNQRSYQKVMVMFLIAQTARSFQLRSLRNLLFKNALKQSRDRKLADNGLPTPEDTSSSLLMKLDQKIALVPQQITQDALKVLNQELKEVSTNIMQIQQLLDENFIQSTFAIFKKPENERTIEREFDALCTVSQSQMTNAKPRYLQVEEMFKEAAHEEDETESPLRRPKPSNGQGGFKLQTKQELDMEMAPREGGVIQEENMQYNDLLASEASSLNFSIEQDA